MAWIEQDTESSIAERFEQQVKARADHPAIGRTPSEVTYAQLGAIVDRYAAALLERGDADERVAMLLRHDVPVLAGALAALKCGMTVVTLNPSEPAARLAQIRTAVQPDLLLTDQPYLEHARAAGFQSMSTLSVAELGHRPARRALGPPPGPEQTAFLICTSGSTGKPKVVIQSHRNMLHNVLRYTNGLEIKPEDRLAWLASLSGGQGLATALTALLNGATLCPFPIAERGVTGLGGWLRECGVTVFDTIPSVLRSFAQTLHGERIPGMRLVRIASEGALDSDFETFKRHFPANAKLASVLASSEAGIIAQGVISAGDEVPEGRLPVGRAAEGVAVILLDEGGSAVPAGEVGEIVIEGRYLSSGYWHDEELTARRFEVVDGARRLRTGDLARQSAAGVLTVIGRADKQVKVRGNRLQLEEVETALAAHLAVSAALVTLRQNARGDAKLTAYLTTTPGRAVSTEELRRALGETLPPFAIPASFIFLAEFPLTPHGKIDRERLVEIGDAQAARVPLPAAPDTRPAARDTRPAPAAGTGTEEVLLGLWSQAFEREVSPHDAFLELGGDSLLAAVIAAGVHEAFGVEVDLRVFASGVTVASLAALVDGRRTIANDDELPPLRRMMRTGPLSSGQLRFWNSAAFARGEPSLHVSVPFAIRGALDVAAFRASVEEIVRRHEILRTSYVEVNGRPAALVRRPEPVELPVDDLRAESDPDARAEQILESEMLAPFDLEHGPLLRLRLLWLGDQEYRLVRTSHHMIHDAVSWRIFFKELAVIYDALRQGRPSPLPGEPPLQYIDYAAWESDSLRPESRRYQAEVEWWRRRFDSPVPPLKLPFERTGPDPEAPAAGFLGWGIPAAHSASLDALGRSVGATYFMTRLAAYAALLALETGAGEFLIGTPVSTRTRAELHNMFGVFINVAELRLRFAGAPSFRSWLGDVRRAVIDTGARVAIPVEQLMPELRRRGVTPPSSQARFIAAATLAPTRFGGLELEQLPRRCVEARGFRLGVNRLYEADRCWVEFDPRVHDPGAVQQFLSRLQALVAAICAEPDRSLNDLHLAVSLT